jgi:hypothetical protein
VKKADYDICISDFGRRMVFYLLRTDFVFWSVSCVGSNKHIFETM